MSKNQDYKKTLDFPNPKSDHFICSNCSKENNLPANYCSYCGKELEDWNKQGLNSKKEEKSLEKFLATFTGIFSKYESLDDINKYDIEYLYQLLFKNDVETQRNFTKHMPMISRTVIGLGIVLMITGAILGSALKEEPRIALPIFSLLLTFGIGICKVAESNYKDSIKNQIEYLKYLEGKNE